MPGKLIPGEKRTMAYKKQKFGTPYKMKGYTYPGTSPVMKTKTTPEERAAMTPAERLLAVVPDKAAYDALASDEERAAFDKAAKEAGLPQMQSKKKSPVENYKKGYYGA